MLLSGQPVGPVYPADVIRMVAEGSLAPQRAVNWLSVLERRAGARPGADGESGAPAGASDALEAAWRDLDKLIGLDRVKTHLREVLAYAHMQVLRQQHGLHTEPIVLHTVMFGRPGTGKTTVARLMSRILHAAGLLSKGHIVETERADLVGEYVGHTAQRTKEQIRKATGGVLFVDEAYSLMRGGEKDFGREAIDCLVKAMEDQRHDLVVILAGYPEEMAEFLAVNPGLESRFPIQIEFPDYTLAEMQEIARLMCQERDYELSEAAAEALGVYVSIARLLPNFGNARVIRNVLEGAMRRQAWRLLNPDADARRRGLSRRELMQLLPEDLGEEVLACAKWSSSASPTPGRRSFS